MTTSHTLFDSHTASERSDAPTAAKSVIDKLLKVRRGLSTSEQEFALPKINSLIEELRSLMRATDTQREEMILYSVEVQGACTETEISEDTKLHRTLVNQLVRSLIEKEVLYHANRFVPGMDRPRPFLKSNRIKTKEMG